MFFLNIHSRGSYPADALSNFAAHAFELDGIPIAGMEGFLQSLKTSDPETQRQICALAGKEAKRIGTTCTWDRVLFWNGQPSDRRSAAYRQLIERAYRAMLCNPEFTRALTASKGKLLLHTIGKWRRSKTVLTWWEFCGLLMKLRKEILS